MCDVVLMQHFWFWIRIASARLVTLLISKGNTRWNQTTDFIFWIDSFTMLWSTNMQQTMRCVEMELGVSHLSWLGLTSNLYSFSNTREVNDFRRWKRGEQVIEHGESESEFHLPSDLIWQPQTNENWGFQKLVPDTYFDAENSNSTTTDLALSLVRHEPMRIRGFEKSILIVS